MTEVNGLRLAFRGLVAGMAAGWVWLATAMLGSLAVGEDPLRPLRIIGAHAPNAGLVLAAAVIQVAAAGIGLGFAYFFGRYFTVRGTLFAAATTFALLAWLTVADVRAGSTGWTGQIVLCLAALAYGITLGAGIPVRGEVMRYPSEGSAST
jgi:hypothetical protein